MAVKKRIRKTKIEFTDIIWVLDNLTENQMKAHDKKPYTPEQLTELEMQMVDDGFRVTAKWDEYSKSYMATATNMDVTKDNASLAIAARGTTIEDCKSILFYKYIVIAAKDLRGFTDKVPTGVRG